MYPCSFQASTTGAMPSPGRASNLDDVSSAVSTLSSFSSTSSDEQRLRVPARRKLPAKKPPSAKRAKHDTSSDTTSSYTRKTTSSDTSHDTSHDKSHDTSNDRSREDEKDISGSQQDMFGDERECSSSVGSSSPVVRKNRAAASTIKLRYCQKYLLIYMEMNEKVKV